MSCALTYLDKSQLVQYPSLAKSNSEECPWGCCWLSTTCCCYGEVGWMTFTWREDGLWTRTRLFMTVFLTGWGFLTTTLRFTTFLGGGFVTTRFLTTGFFTTLLFGCLFTTLRLGAALLLTTLLLVGFDTRLLALSVSTSASTSASEVTAFEDLTA